MIVITIINFAIMGGFLYLIWCGLKWIILRPYLKLKKESKDEQDAINRAHKYGRPYSKTVDGGVIYPENKESEEVLLIERKHK